MTKIKIIASNPKIGEAPIENHIGETYTTIPLEKLFVPQVIERMKELGQIAVNLNDGDNIPSVLNSDEYEIIEN